MNIKMKWSLTPAQPVTNKEYQNLYESGIHTNKITPSPTLLKLSKTEINSMRNYSLRRI